MAFTAGVFTDTLIGNVKLNQQEILITNRMSELNYEVIAGGAILMNQDPNIVTMGFGESCIGADIYTLRSDSTDKGSSTFACAVGTGPEAGSEKLTLTKTSLVNHEQFYIKDILCNNAVDFQAQLAYFLMKAKVNLEAKLSKALVALAATGADTPDEDWFETPGTVNGTVFEIAASEFDKDKNTVLGDLSYAARYTEMLAPIFLNGRNFYNKKVLAEFESLGCCTTNAALNSGSMFQYYWDVKNVDSVTSAKSSFVIDRNAILFWSSPVYSNLGMESAMTDGKEAADRYHFVDTLPRLQYYANGQMNPIYVDVRMERACVLDSLNVPRDAWKFELGLYGAMTLNLPNQEDYQGIIHVQNVPGA